VKAKLSYGLKEKQKGAISERTNFKFILIIGYQPLIIKKIWRK